MSTDDLRKASWDALRPSVRRFAYHMESVLRQNDHKGGWENEPLPDLWYKLEEETKELAHRIMVTDHGAGIGASGSEIRHEAVDVANYAMMIFDNTLPGPMPNPCVEVGPPSSNFEMKKSAMQLALDALKRFNETGGVDCLGFCFYIHDPDKPSYVMAAWAPEGQPLYGDGATYKRAKPIIDIDGDTSHLEGEIVVEYRCSNCDESLASAVEENLDVGVVAGEVTIAHSVAWAKRALDVYAVSTGITGEDMELRISDLLADLHHLADDAGVDWQIATERGENHYEEEAE